MAQEGHVRKERKRHAKRDEAERLLREGLLTDGEIGELLDVSTCVVGVWRRALGLPLLPRKREVKRAVRMRIPVHRASDLLRGLRRALHEAQANECS